MGLIESLEQDAQTAWLELKSQSGHDGMADALTRWFFTEGYCEGHAAGRAEREGDIAYRTLFTQELSDLKRENKRLRLAVGSYEALEFYEDEENYHSADDFHLSHVARKALNPKGDESE